MIGCFAPTHLDRGRRGSEECSKHSTTAPLDAVACGALLPADVRSADVVSAFKGVADGTEEAGEALTVSSGVTIVPGGQVTNSTALSYKQHRT